MFYKYTHKQMKKKPNILDRYSSLLKILFYENNMEPFIKYTVPDQKKSVKLNKK